MFFYLALALSLQLARAADAPPEMVQPKVIKIVGQPAQAIWPSGNRAELRLNQNSPMTMSVEVGITENLCNDKLGSAFVLNLGARIDRIAWVWVEHKNAAKIGKVVTFTKGSIPLADFVFVTNALKFFSPNLTFDIPADSLTFTDIKWIPGFEDGTMRPLTIKSWSVEDMTINSETGASENRITATATDVRLLPLGPKLASILNIEAINTTRTVADRSFALAGDVISWVIISHGKDCQISFKPNLGKVQGEVGKIIATLPNDFVTYNWMSDDHSLSADGPNSLTKFIGFADE